MSNLVYFFITKVNNNYFKNGKKIDPNCVTLTHLHKTKEEIFNSLTLIKELATAYMDQYEGIPLILATGKKKMFSSNYKIIAQKLMSKEDIINSTEDKVLLTIALNNLELKSYRGEPIWIKEIIYDSKYMKKSIENNDEFGKFVGNLPLILSQSIEKERSVPALSSGMRLKHKTKGYIVNTVKPFAPSHRYLICLSPEEPSNLNKLLKDIYKLKPHFKERRAVFIGSNRKYKTESMNLSFSEVHSIFEII